MRSPSDRDDVEPARRRTREAAQEVARGENEALSLRRAAEAGIAASAHPMKTSVPSRSRMIRSTSPPRATR